MYLKVTVPMTRHPKNGRIPLLPEREQGVDVLKHAVPCCILSLATLGLAFSGYKKQTEALVVCFFIPAMKPKQFDAAERQVEAGRLISKFQTVSQLDEPPDIHGQLNFSFGRRMLLA